MLVDDNCKKQSTALKAGAWYTVANFVSRGVGFLTAPVFNRLLSKGEVGDFANFTSWGYILVSIITLDLFSSVILAKFDYKEKFNQYISSILVLGTIWTAFVYVVSFLFKETIMNLLGFSELEFHIMFVVALFSPAMNIIQMKNRIEFKYKLSVFLSLISTVVSTLISLICVLSFNNRLNARLLGLNIPLFILYVGIYLYLIISAKGFSIKYWKYALCISVPLIFNVMGGHLLTSCDRVMVRNICGTEDTALYSVAYSAAFVVSILFSSINGAWSPWALQQMNDNKIHDLRKASRIYLSFFIILVFCYLLIAPEVLWIVGGKSYMTSIGVLPPVIVGVGFQAAYAMYVDIETFCKKQKQIAIGSFFGALFNIILNFIFIPIFGYIAAAYTTLAGYVFLFTIHFMVVKKLGHKEWYDSKYNIVLLLVLVISLPLFLLLYKFNIVRYVIIGIITVAFIVALVIFHEGIKDLLKNKSLNVLKQQVGVYIHNNWRAK